MRLALAVITATVAGLIAVESVSAQGVLPPSAPPAHEATEKGDKQKGVLPPGAAAPLPPPPAAGKDGGDKLGALKELDKAGAAGGRLPLSEYKFPGLIGAVFEGKLEDVPDDKATRVVVFSIVKGYADFCGPTPADVMFHAMPYASDIARLSYRNPTEGGFKLLEEMAKSALKGQREGLVSGVEDFISKHGMIAQEGLDDTRILVERHGCAGEVQGRFYGNLARLISSRSSREPGAFEDVKFWALMSPAYRRLHNIPDPAVIQRERRLKKLADAAQASCVRQYSHAGFCGCVVGALRSMQFAHSDWEKIGPDFPAIAKMGAKYSGLRASVHSCNRR